MAIATGISTSVRVSNCRVMDSRRRVCAYSTAAYATTPAGMASSITSANAFSAASNSSPARAAMPTMAMSPKVARPPPTRSHACDMLTSRPPPVFRNACAPECHERALGDC